LLGCKEHAAYLWFVERSILFLEESSRLDWKSFLPYQKSNAVNIEDDDTDRVCWLTGHEYRT
jgi:hypothetical protein